MTVRLIDKLSNDLRELRVELSTLDLVQEPRQCRVIRDCIECLEDRLEQLDEESSIA